MMTDITKLTDPYERKARLYPALLCILPIAVAISVSFPVIYSTLSGLVALVAAFGGLQLLSHLARDRGKKLENRLFNEWGGRPSVSIFRHGDSLIPKPVKLRYHELLSERTGISGPSAESEISNSSNADEIYSAWSYYLRTKTRDSKKYSLLFKENINYGFRRNLMGLRWHCLSSGVLGLGIVVIPNMPSVEFTQIEWSIVVLNALYILVFLLIVKGAWVKIIAVEYAKRLAEAVDE